MIFAALISILILLMGGAGLGMALLPRRRCQLPEAMGLSVILGAFLVTFGWFLLSFFLVGDALRYGVAALCVAAFIAGLARWRREPEMRMDWDGAWVFATALLAQFIFVLWQAFLQPLEGDGMLIWELKGRMIFENGGQLAPLQLSSTWNFTHPTYPLEVPILDSWIFSWGGQAHEGLAKLIFPLFFAASAGLIWTMVQRATGDSRRARWASLLLFFVPWAILQPGGATSGWADFPLGASYLAALVYALDLMASFQASSGKAHAEPRPVALLACCLASLVWIKTEGIVLAGAAFLVLQASFPKARKLEWAKALACSAAGPLIVAIAWQAFLQKNNACPNSDFQPFTLHTLNQNLYRAPVIAYLVGRELVNFERWSLLWPLALLALAHINRRLPVQALALGTAIGIPGLFYSFVYIFSAWPSYPQHIASSLSRVLIPLALPAVAAIGLGLTRSARATASDSCEKQAAERSR